MPAVPSTPDLALTIAVDLRAIILAAHVGGIVTPEEADRIADRLTVLTLLLCRLEEQHRAGVHVIRTGRLPRDYHAA